VPRVAEFDRLPQLLPFVLPPRLLGHVHHIKVYLPSWRNVLLHQINEFFSSFPLRPLKILGSVAVLEVEMELVFDSFGEFLKFRNHLLVFRQLLGMVYLT